MKGLAVSVQRQQGTQFAFTQTAAQSPASPESVFTAIAATTFLPVLLKLILVLLVWQEGEVVAGVSWGLVEF